MIVATTERLVLRELDERDAENIFLLNADPEVLKYVHDVPFKDIEAARLWIGKITQQWPNGIGRWVIETKNGPWIGRCSLRQGDDGTTMMGYRMLREHWGKGYATEAVRAMLDQAFNSHKLSFVVSAIAPGNIASRRVIEKNGGVFWKEAVASNFAGVRLYRFER